jgi:hypothetical protein
MGLPPAMGVAARAGMAERAEMAEVAAANDKNWRRLVVGSSMWVWRAVA